MELVFHELVTNAVKFGALSNDVGTLAVRWNSTDHTDGPHAAIEWIESGGPTASEGVGGFGSLLIQSTVAHDLAGVVTMAFEPPGLRCSIDFPLLEGRS